REPDFQQAVGHERDGNDREEKRHVFAEQRSADFPPSAELSHTGRGLFQPGDHSITSSARSRKDSGIFSPMARAVLRLTTSSNLVGCWTGKSAGFSPLRMRST